VTAIVSGAVVVGLATAVTAQQAFNYPYRHSKLAKREKYLRQQLVSSSNKDNTGKQ